MKAHLVNCLIVPSISRSSLLPTVHVHRSVLSLRSLWAWSPDRRACCVIVVVKIIRKNGLQIRGRSVRRGASGKLWVHLARGVHHFQSAHDARSVSQRVGPRISAPAMVVV